MKYIVIKKTVREETLTFEASNDNEAYIQVMETDHSAMKVINDDCWQDGLEWFSAEAVQAIAAPLEDL